LKSILAHGLRAWIRFGGIIFFNPMPGCSPIIMINSYFLQKEKKKKKRRKEGKRKKKEFNI